MSPKINMSPDSKNKKNDFQDKKKSIFSSDNKKNTKDSFFVKPKRPVMDDRFKEVLGKKKSHNKQAQQKPSDHDSDKKPFDKKAWRFKRYSKKFKLEQWKETRKSRILQRYDKELNKNEHQTIDYTKFKEDDYENEEGMSESNQPDIRGKNQKRQEYSSEKAEENVNQYMKRKMEKEAAIKEYKRKKLEKSRKLNSKTKKGQPIMKHRIEVLLEEIQNSLKN